MDPQTTLCYGKFGKYEAARVLIAGSWQNSVCEQLLETQQAIPQGCITHLRYDMSSTQPFSQDQMLFLLHQRLQGAHVHAPLHHLTDPRTQNPKPHAPAHAAAPAAARRAARARVPPCRPSQRHGCSRRTCPPRRRSRCLHHTLCQNHVRQQATSTPALPDALARHCIAPGNVHCPRY